MVMTTRATGFQGAGVVLFESRMAEPMATSVVSHGGAVISAPAMREVPLADHHEALAFGERLLAGQVDLLICMTGVGTRLLLETLAARHDRQRVIEALSRLTVVARGPKPIRALKEWQIPVTIAVPEPNTWREILDTLDASDRGVDLGGRTVAIQEYGAANLDLIASLQQRGARVLRVPVYRWALPEDTRPLEAALRRIVDGEAAFALFTSAVQARHLLQVAASAGLEERLRTALARVVVASIGPTTSETLRACGLPVDFEPSHPKMGVFIDEVAKQAEALLRRKRAPLRPAAPSVAGVRDDRALRRESLFLRACRREATPVTPVWLMRQAGRYMPEYRAIRNKVSFLELCKRPDLATEVAVTAARRLGVDAAILFSDILLIVEPLGLELEYSQEEGPVIAGQVASAADVDQLPEIQPEESLAFVFEAVRATRAALPSSLPLIGFAGAPFTLAAYIIEGGGSKSFLHTKRLMYADPGAWHALLGKIGRGLVKYLNGQIAAGADAVQLFDSWVGCLGPADYREFVLPHTRAVIQGLTPGTPVIHFGTGTGPFVQAVREAGGDVIGVDFRVELDAAWRAIGHDRAIQGNLDPAVLCAPRDIIRARVQQIVQQADGRAGHIFNLGHGILPSTPVEHAIAMVEYVHELSRR